MTTRIHLASLFASLTLAAPAYAGRVICPYDCDPAVMGALSQWVAIQSYLGNVEESSEEWIALAESLIAPLDPIYGIEGSANLLLRSLTATLRETPYALDESTTTHEVGHWLSLYHTMRPFCPDLEPRVPSPGAVDPISNWMDYTDDLSIMDLRLQSNFPPCSPGHHPLPSPRH